MKRLIINAIIKTGAKSILLTTVIGVIIGIVGHLNKWNSPITYSNAFFLAGCLVIIAGTSSHLAAGQVGSIHQILNTAESFRGMSSSERATFFIDASSSVSTLVLGLLSGILLILISAVAAYLF